MNIDTNVIQLVVGKVIPSDLTFDHLGFVNDESENVLSFCDDERYLEELDEAAARAPIDGALLKEEPLHRRREEGDREILILGIHPKGGVEAPSSSARPDRWPKR